MPSMFSSIGDAGKSLLSGIGKRIGPGSAFGDTFVEGRSSWLANKPHKLVTTPSANAASRLGQVARVVTPVGVGAGVGAGMSAAIDRDVGPGAAAGAAAGAILVPSMAAIHRWEHPVNRRLSRPTVVPAAHPWFVNGASALVPAASIGLSEVINSYRSATPRSVAPVGDPNQDATQQRLAELQKRLGASKENLGVARENLARAQARQPVVGNGEPKAPAGPQSPPVADAAGTPTAPIAPTATGAPAAPTAPAAPAAPADLPQDAGDAFVESTRRRLADPAGFTRSVTDMPPEARQKQLADFTKLPVEARKNIVKGLANDASQMPKDFHDALYQGITGTTPEKFGQSALESMFNGVDIGGHIADMLGMSDQWKSLPFESRASYTAAGLGGLISLVGLLMGSNTTAMLGLGLGGLAGLYGYMNQGSGQPTPQPEPNPGAAGAQALGDGAAGAAGGGDPFATAMEDGALNSTELKSIFANPNAKSQLFGMPDQQAIRVLQASAAQDPLVKSKLKSIKSWGGLATDELTKAGLSPQEAARLISLVSQMQ